MLICYFLDISYAISELNVKLLFSLSFHKDRYHI